MHRNLYPRIPYTSHPNPNAKDTMKTSRTKTKPQMLSEPQLPFSSKKQRQPGLESKLDPTPLWQAPRYQAAGKLKDKVALITGGDSGIGRSVAFLYAREGADVAIVFLPVERADAEVTKNAVEAAGRRCLLIPKDISRAPACRSVIATVIKKFGKLDIVVSNAAHQTRKESLEKVTDEEWDLTFRTNIYACFWLVKAALPHLKAGAAIIVTSSETGIFGSQKLFDYSATKGAINAFCKALSMDVAKRGIRVNAIAPGPVWTPLNPADPGLPKKQTAQFGKDTQFGRPAQPEELAPAYVFLASDADSSYITGIVLPIMGGETTGG